MIETDATNVIWNRRSKVRRKRKQKRKSKSCEWKFWWKSWLQRDVENVWFFVWRKGRFLWQNRANRFRRRRLLKTLRIRAFQTLTNRCLLIDCRHEIENYSWLMHKEETWLTKWTNVEALRRRKDFLILTQIKWSRLFTKHVNQIIDDEIRFLMFWYRCSKRWSRKCKWTIDW